LSLNTLAACVELANFLGSGENRDQQISHDAEGLRMHPMCGTAKEMTLRSCGREIY